jgi:uncharacterized protein with PQ loop repeat
MVISHLLQRKRKHILKEKFPPPNLGVNFLDKLVYLVAIVTPFATLPQIYTIWWEKKADGVSLLTWSLYIILGIPMFIYCWVHKEKPLILMYFLLLIVNGLVLLGAILHG